MTPEEVRAVPVWASSRLSRQAMSSGVHQSRSPPPVGCCPPGGRPPAIARYVPRTRASGKRGSLDAAGLQVLLYEGIGGMGGDDPDDPSGPGGAWAAVFERDDGGILVKHRVCFLDSFFLKR